MDLREFNRGLHGSVINSLKYVSVELHGILALKRESHFAKSICQTLNANSNRSVAPVAVLSLNDRVKCSIDNPNQAKQVIHCLIFKIYFRHSRTYLSKLRVTTFVIS
jgi:hypothetical protein